MGGVFSRVRCDCAVKAVQEEESGEGMLWSEPEQVDVDVALDCDGRSGVFGEDLVDG